MYIFIKDGGGLLREFLELLSEKMVNSPNLYFEYNISQRVNIHKKAYLNSENKTYFNIFGKVF